MTLKQATTRKLKNARLRVPGGGIITCPAAAHRRRHRRCSKRRKADIASLRSKPPTETPGAIFFNAFAARPRSWSLASSRKDGDVRRQLRGGATAMRASSIRSCLCLHAHRDQHKSRGKLHRSPHAHSARESPPPPPPQKKNVRAARRCAQTPCMQRQDAQLIDRATI